MRHAERQDLEQAIDRLRFALGVDEDLAGFCRQFKGDRLLGPLIRRWPHLRPIRHSSPWEALTCAIAGQLIEARRAAAISRRIVRRWGAEGPGRLRDAPGPTALAACAPAELQAMDLSAGRSIAMRRVAVEVGRGRVELADPGSAARLAAIPEIGPWTLQCVGLLGRGEQDTLPAGDLDYLKLIGQLAGLGRRAEVAEVEEFFAPYEPYRGLAGVFMRHGLRRRIVPAA